jgi:DNA polymerase III subunit gamma/tau
VLQELALLLHDLALVQNVPTAQLTGQWDLSELASAFDAETVQVLYQIALTGRRDLPLSPDERAGFTMTLLRMLAFVPASASALPKSTPAARPLRASVGPSATVMPKSAVFVPTPQVFEDGSDRFEGENGGFEDEAARGAPVRLTPGFSPDGGAELSIVPAAQISRGDTLSPNPSPRGGGESAASFVAEQTSESDTLFLDPSFSGREELASSRLPPSSSPSFDGNWPALVARLPLVALTREFARNTALVKREGNVFHLVLPEDKRPLIKHQAKLKDILIEYFGRPVRLEVELGNADAVQAEDSAPAPTLAKQEVAARSERQKQAHTEFMSAPFVQALVRDAGATVHVETIQPVGE